MTDNQPFTARTRQLPCIIGKGNYRPEADIKKPAEEGFASIE
jgi:hypothetical protein